MRYTLFLLRIINAFCNSFFCSNSRCTSNDSASFFKFRDRATLLTTQRANFFIYTAFWLLFLICSTQVTAQRIMEKLGRGVVATRTSKTKVLVSWRLLGTEPQDIGFNVYRSANGGSALKLNTAVLTAGTNFEDLNPNLTIPNSYFVKPVLRGVEQDASASYTLIANADAKPFYKIKIHNTLGYRIKYASVGDFDGDGEYDYVMHKTPISDYTLPDLVEAYKRDGTYLWTINMGPNSVNRYNITPGSSSLEAGHGDNWTVYDLNGDGKAEVILRTANGVKFSDSTTLIDANNGKQFISVIDGMTGHEISRTPVNNPYITKGDDYGQMNGHMGIAYLDGIHPSVVWMPANRNADQSFNEMIFAWDWNGTTLISKWTFDLGGKDLPSGHQIKIFDIDGDGKDEIIPQAFAVNDDGTLMYNLKDQAIDHGDRFSISDLDPKRPGLEIYGIQQGYSKLGIMWYYCDVKTGKLLASQSNPANNDMGRGMTADVDPRYLGQELYTFVGSLYSVSGVPTSTAIPSVYPNQRMYWDGDLGGELLDGGKIVKWNYLTNNDTRLYTASSVTGTGASASVTQVTPAFYGDIIGDWREEAVYESQDHEYLIIVETPYTTTERIYTLPHNPGYRSDMCVKGYYQSNNTDYYLGFDMQQPPIPCIQTANDYWTGTESSVWDNSITNWTNGTTAKPYTNGDTIMFDLRGKNIDTVRLNSNVSPGKIWLINPEGKNYTVSGTGKITGTGEVWKTMGGTFTFAGDHDYSGATIISNGQINIDGSLQSSVTVRGLGAIGGRGTFYGGVTLHKGVNVKGGRISPGFGNINEQRLGSITIQGDLAVSGDNNFEFDVLPGSAKVNDSLIVTGNLSFKGINQLIFNFADNKFVPGTYTIIKCGGTLSATLSNFEISGITGVPKELIIEGNEIKIKINDNRSPANLIWSGAVNNLLDFKNQNFTLGITPTAFVSGDTLTFDASSIQKTVVLNETVYPSSITFNSDSNYTIQGTDSICGTGGITKNGTGNLSILSTANTYSGKTIVNGGTLTVGKVGLRNEASSMGAADSTAQNIQINNATLVVNEKSITNRSFKITGVSTFNIPVADNYLIFNADITGTGTLVKDGPGSIYMVGKKSFSGPVLIKAGVLNLRTREGNVNGLGTSNDITLENATLNIEDIQASEGIYWNLTVPSNKVGTLFTDGRSTMFGTLNGSGTLNLKIPYVRTNFNGDWSQFGGRINVIEGDFRIGNTKGYANCAINLLGGAMYSIAGASATTSIGELAGITGTTITSDLATANWTIGALNTDATFSGNIVKSSLTKVGTGTLIVDGNNTYTGKTLISGGRLLVNNAVGKRGIGSGTVSVANGAVLGGIGAVMGAVTVNTGGTIQPGFNGIGTFIDSSNIVFLTGAIADMEINKTSSTFDVLKTTGNIVFNGKLLVEKVGIADYSVGDNFQLFQAGSYSGNFTSILPSTPGTGLLWKFTPANGTLSVIADTILPITLANLTVKPKNDEVVLNWETKNEINNRHFIIEHSKDGQNFEAIGTVKAAGTSSETNRYVFVDKTPYVGINYYRLVQVDVDGHRTISAIKQTQWNKGLSGMVISPNPTGNYIQIHLKKSEQVLHATISGLDGKLFFEYNGSLDKLNAHLKANAPSKPGTYLVRIESSSDTWVGKYVKQ